MSLLGTALISVSTRCMFYTLWEAPEVNTGRPGSAAAWRRTERTPRSFSFYSASPARETAVRAQGLCATFFTRPFLSPTDSFIVTKA